MQNKNKNQNGDRNKTQKTRLEKKTQNINVKKLLFLGKTSKKKVASKVIIKKVYR